MENLYQISVFSVAKRDSTLHTLNGCKTTLEQGRMTWRHNNIVKYIVDSIDTNKYKVYSDIEGKTTPNGGTLQL